MIDILVTMIFIVLPLVNWPVAITLLRLSLRRPRIRALSERAFLAFLIAVMTTGYSVVVVNSSTGYHVMDRDTGRNVVRLFVVLIGLYPIWWLWAYYTGRFKDGE